MHAIFAARVIIENQQPRTRREAILQEEKFYTDMAEASRPLRFFSALIGLMKAKKRRSVEEGDEGRESTGCDEAQAKDDGSRCQCGRWQWREGGDVQICSCAGS